MALFDNVFGPDVSDERDLTGPEAFAGTLLAAGACNGHITRAQLRGFYAITERMRLFEDAPRAKRRAIADGLTKSPTRDGARARARRCAPFLPDGMRECAFANACDIVLADGTVDPDERAFLESL